MSGKSKSVFASKGYKKLMGKVYGFGAAVVILGALFKIMHWPFCDEMLIIGLSTEALIFALSAMEPLHAEPNWAVYYPYLLPEDERPQSAEELAAFPKPLDLAGGAGGDSSTGITEKFDELLANAKIDQALLDRLGSSMRDLSNNAEQLKSVSLAATATESYVTNLEAASQSVATLVSDYKKASLSLVGITEAQKDGEQMGMAMQGVSKNLTALNNVYELQLQGSSAHLEATQNFQQQIIEMMGNLSASAEDTKLYRENMAMLAQNLTDLNNVYGNMLKAMKS